MNRGHDRQCRDGQTAKGLRPTKTIAVSMILAGFTFAIFAPAIRYDFVNLDDNVYVSENPLVKRGLTWTGFKQAFAEPRAALWTPLLWLSYMTDTTLFGVSAKGYHFTNILLHSFNVALLFWLLSRLTGRTGIAVWVATMFAVHPLVVEPVVWVASRKDVLSGFFWMLTLHGYVTYARLPGPRTYALVVVGLLAALLAKPIAVTLPFVLLLLDFWPLGRASTTPWRRLLKEKIPLFALTAAFCISTYLAQMKAGALVSDVKAPPAVRLPQVAEAYLTYAWRTICPIGLSVLYPVEAQVRWGMFALGLAMITIVSAIAWRVRREVPAILVGWLWFVGVLVPVIGIVRFGVAHIADRFMYLPLIGLLIMAAWGITQAAERHRWTRWAASLAGVGLLATCALLTRGNLPRWRNSLTLFSDAVNKGSHHMAFNNLGYALTSAGRHDEAAAYYREALKLCEDSAPAHNNLGTELGRVGANKEALAHFLHALRIWPTFPEANLNAGAALIALGEYEKSVPHLQKALDLREEWFEARLKLGTALLAMSRPSEAAVHLTEAVRLRTDSAVAQNNLGSALLAMGKAAQAAMHLQTALYLNPDDVDAMNNLAWIRATNKDANLRSGTEAVRLAEKANTLSGGQNPDILDTLSAAYAEASRFQEAIAAAKKATSLYRERGQQESTRAMEERLRAYSDQKKWRD